MDDFGACRAQANCEDTEMSIQLYISFLAGELGTTPDRVSPEYADAKRMQALLWPAASFFQTVAGIAEYRETAESEADGVIEALEANPTTWTDFTSDAARVLYDRATYAIAVLQGNVQVGERVICPPVSLDEDMQRVAAALLWLHKMELPNEWRGTS